MPALLVRFFLLIMVVEEERRMGEGVAGLA